MAFPTRGGQSGQSVQPAHAVRERDIAAVLADEGLYVGVTSGVSMRPMLRERRDTIVIRPLAAGERLRVGDVPLYRDGSRTVLHRVVGVRDGWYAVRGDNCLMTEHVTDKQVIGRLSEWHHGERRISCDDVWYRCYWRIWLATWPVRRCWRLARIALGRVRRRLWRHS